MLSGTRRLAERVNSRVHDWPKMVSYIILVAIVILQLAFAFRLQAVIDCQTRYNSAAAADRLQFNHMLVVLATSPNQQERAKSFFDYVQYTKDHPLTDPKEFCK